MGEETKIIIFFEKISDRAFLFEEATFRTRWYWIPKSSFVSPSHEWGFLSDCLCFLHLSRYKMILASCINLFFVIVCAPYITFLLPYDSSCMYELFFSDWPFHIKAFLVYLKVLFHMILATFSIHVNCNLSESYLIFQRSIDKWGLITFCFWERRLKGTLPIMKFKNW